MPRFFHAHCCDEVVILIINSMLKVYYTAVIIVKLRSAVQCLLNHGPTGLEVL